MSSSARTHWKKAYALPLLRVLAFFAVPFGVTFLLASRSIVSDPFQSATTGIQSRKPGLELVLVYVGSSTCPFCADPRLPKMVHDAQDRLEKEAARSGASFSAIGIGVDLDWRRGIKHLRKIGDFAEVSVGQLWTNQGILRLAQSSGQAEFGTPFLIVLARSWNGREQAPLAKDLLFEREILRLRGPEAINEWLTAGAALPKWKEAH